MCYGFEHSNCIKKSIKKYKYYMHLSPFVFFTDVQTLVLFRGVSKDFEWSVLRLKRHKSAIALKKELEYIGFDDLSFFAMITTKEDIIDILKCFSDYAFDAKTKILYQLSCRRDPFFKNSKRIFVNRLKRKHKNVWALVG
jgi:hypothetical protein